MIVAQHKFLRRGVGARPHEHGPTLYDCDNVNTNIIGSVVKIPLIGSIHRKHFIFAGIGIALAGVRLHGNIGINGVAKAGYIEAKAT